MAASGVDHWWRPMTPIDRWAEFGRCRTRPLPFRADINIAALAAQNTAAHSIQSARYRDELNITCRPKSVDHVSLAHEIRHLHGIICQGKADIAERSKRTAAMPASDPKRVRTTPCQQRRLPLLYFAGVVAEAARTFIANALH